MDIAIIGAGVAGMTAAYDISNAGHKVTIYEAANYVGGLASGFKEPHWNWSVEKFYHHWFAGDHEMLELIDQLGLAHKVQFPRPYTVVNHQEKWYPFDSPLQALMFPGLGWGLDKIRFGLVGLFLRLTNNWQSLEKTTVDHWMRKWAGNSVYEKMWQPLMDGKFGPYAKQVNMAWMWARIKARTTRLGTYEGGFQQFADDFADHLKNHKNVQLKISTPVSSIQPSPDKNSLVINTAEGQNTYDRVLVTTGPGLLLKLVPDLPEEYISGLKNLKSMGAVVMVYSLKQKLSPQDYYWYNIPKSSGFPFLALVEHTNFVPKENFGNDIIVYCGDYLPENHDFMTAPKETIQAAYTPALKRINPLFNESWIKKTWLFRTKYAQPVPFINHSKNIPAIQTPIDGLFFASMSHIYPWDRGTNFAVQIGRKAARLLLAN